MIYDVIIIGSGPAGLAAGVYAQRARLSSIIIEYTFLSIYIRPSGGKLPLKRPETATVAEEIQTEQA